MLVIDASVLLNALQALAAANRLGLRRHPSRSLWPRAWELRSNLTADARLARAPGLRCVVELAEA